MLSGSWSSCWLWWIFREPTSGAEPGPCCSLNTEVFAEQLKCECLTTQPSEVENELIMQVQNLERTALEKYRVENRSQHIYRAASRLWVTGLPWADALSIVEDAFDACIQDSR